jgi:murein DD-endopeptidase MepM/ murein hydrolase activator NlpD
MPRILSLSLAVSVALALAATPGSAQVRVPPVGGSPSPSPSPSSAPRPSPSPTYSLPDPDPTPEDPGEEPQPQPSPTRSTKRPTTSGGSTGSSRTGSSTSPSRPTSGSSGSSGATTPRRADSPTMSPFVARSIQSWVTREKTPAHTTTRLLELIDAAQPNGEEASLRERALGFGRFPVVGYVWYQDDFGAPRWYPTYHPHLGTDLFAKSGTPVIACADGTIVRWSQGGGGGNALWLMGDDGVRYYYGHLRSFAPGVNAEGRRIRLGDIIGTVGATGQSATGTYPHVHFEISLPGRGEVNPKPILDSWLRRAEEQAAIAAGLSVGPDSFSPARPGRWVTSFDLVGDAQPSGSAPIWTSALGGSSTATFAELALTELMARDDLTVTAKGADGPVFDPLARLFGPTEPDGHAHDE